MQPVRPVRTDSCKGQGANGIQLPVRKSCVFYA